MRLVLLIAAIVAGFFTVGSLTQGAILAGCLSGIVGVLLFFGAFRPTGGP